MCVAKRIASRSSTGRSSRERARSNLNRGFMWTLLSALFGDRVLGGGQKQLFTRDTDFQLVAVPVGRLIFLFGNLVTEFGNPKPLRAVSTALNFELVFHHPTVNLGPRHSATKTGCQ